MEGLVRLKPKQTYDGCVGVITARLERTHNMVDMYEVLIPDLGTVVRSSIDLEPLTEADITSPDFRFVHPAQWRARLEAWLCMNAVQHALQAGDEDGAAVLADAAVRYEMEAERYGG
jgi:hypothetical protein